MDRIDLASQEGLYCTIARRNSVCGRIKTNLSGSIEAISQHRVERLRNLSHIIQGPGRDTNPAPPIHSATRSANK